MLSMRKRSRSVVQAPGSKRAIAEGGARCMRLGRAQVRRMRVGSLPSQSRLHRRLVC